MTEFKAFTVTSQELDTCRMIAALNCAADCRKELRHCKETGPGTRHAHMISADIRHTSNSIAFASR